MSDAKSVKDRLYALAVLLAPLGSSSGDERWSFAERIREIANDLPASPGSATPALCACGHSAAIGKPPAEAAPHWLRPDGVWCAICREDAPCPTTSSNEEERACGGPQESCPPCRRPTKHEVSRCPECGVCAWKHHRDVDCPAMTNGDMCQGGDECNGDDVWDELEDSLDDVLLRTVPSHPVAETLAGDERTAPRHTKADSSSSAADLARIEGMVEEYGAAQREDARLAAVGMAPNGRLGAARIDLLAAVASLAGRAETAQAEREEALQGELAAIQERDAAAGRAEQAEAAAAAFRFYSDEFCQGDETAEDAAHAMFDAVVAHRQRAEAAEGRAEEAENGWAAMRAEADALHDAIVEQEMERAEERREAEARVGLMEEIVSRGTAQTAAAEGRAERAEALRPLVDKLESEACALTLERDALRARVDGILMFCNRDGSPCDGFRFREEVLAARALVGPSAATETREGEAP